MVYTCHTCLSQHTVPTHLYAACVMLVVSGTHNQSGGIHPPPASDGASGSNHMIKYTMKYQTTLYLIHIPRYARIMQGSHTEITRWAQACNNLTRLWQPGYNLVTRLSACYKVVTTLSRPCNRIVNLFTKL